MKPIVQTLIRPWAKITHIDEAKKYESFERIFFETTSRKRFSDENDRYQFFNQWTEYYLQKEPEHIWLACNDTQVLGYLTGCIDTSLALGELQQKVSSYGLFKDLFSTFPAHLHINFTAQARGQGLGSQLISAFVNQLNEKSVSGLHIVTSPQADNVNFYRKNEFAHEVIRDFNNIPLLFMGRRLEH